VCEFAVSYNQKFQPKDSGSLSFALIISPHLFISLTCLPNIPNLASDFSPGKSRGTDIHVSGMREKRTQHFTKGSFLNALLNRSNNIRSVITPSTTPSSLHRGAFPVGSG
jgi:hypothetical protein